MATWPYNLTPSGVEWRLHKAGVQFRSLFTGSSQAVGFLGEYWEIHVSLRGEGRLQKRSGDLEALLMHLAGGVNTVDVFHWQRPFPRGTLRGSPTLQNATVRGDSQLVINCAAGSNLRAGDLIGAGTQLFMVRSDCVAVSTTITVPVVNRVRGVIGEDSSVVWNRPTVSVVALDFTAGLAYRPGQTLPSEIVLVEP